MGSKLVSAPSLLRVGLSVSQLCHSNNTVTLRVSRGHKSSAPLGKLRPNGNNGN